MWNPTNIHLEYIQNCVHKREVRHEKKNNGKLDMMQLYDELFLCHFNNLVHCNKIPSSYLIKFDLVKNEIFWFLEKSGLIWSLATSFDALV